MPCFVMSYYVVELFPRLLEYIRLYHCSRKYNGCCCDKPRGRFNFFIVLILRCNLEASKTETLDLCQLPRLTIWAHKTQKPHASLGILGQIIKRLPASYGFQQMSWKKPCLLTKTEYLTYFIVKIKIIFFSSSWLSLGLLHTDLMLQFCLPDWAYRYVDIIIMIIIII